MRGYHAIGLCMPKTDANVGSVLRAAFAFGTAFVATTGRRYKPSFTDTIKGVRHLPLLHTADLRAVIPFDCVPVAVELCEGALPLAKYVHPERAFYVFGPEDGSVPPSVLAWCRDVVYIPTRTCLNLAACVNVVLYDRASKRDECPATEILRRETAAL